jgi:AcrR family transcriptional regulator
MVHKAEERRVGRPRLYDPSVALERAMDAFWDGGFSGTSMDDLSARMGMNRPSLYAAFGDKEALYLKTLEGYRAARRALLDAALRNGRPLQEAMRELYQRIIDRFLAGDRGARGCYLIGTAATEAVQNPKVRELLADSQRELDERFRSAFSAAQSKGELGPEADPRAFGMLASALVHTLSLRARAGQPRAVLRAVVDSGLRLFFSGAAVPARDRRRVRKRTGKAARRRSRAPVVH